MDKQKESQTGQEMKLGSHSSFLHLDVWSKLFAMLIQIPRQIDLVTPIPMLETNLRIRSVSKMKLLKLHHES